MLPCDLEDQLKRNAANKIAYGDFSLLKMAQISTEYAVAPDTDSFGEGEHASHTAISSEEMNAIATVSAEECWVITSNGTSISRNSILSNAKVVIASNILPTSA